MSVLVSILAFIYGMQYVKNVHRETLLKKSLKESHSAHSLKLLGGRGAKSFK